MGGQALEDPVAGAALDPELGEELREQVGVAEPDDGAAEADRVERGDQQLDQLRGARRRLGADQLDADLAHLAELAALRTDPAEDARRVGEPERSLGSAANRRATSRAIGTVMSLRSARTEPDSSRKR